MTLWLAIIALVASLVNVCIAPMAITESAAARVDDTEAQASTPPIAEQAGPASVLVFLVRSPRSNPPREREPATETPSEYCRRATQLFAHQKANALARVTISSRTKKARSRVSRSRKAMPTVDDRPPPTENRRPTREPSTCRRDRGGLLAASTSATGCS